MLLSLKLRAIDSLRENGVSNIVMLTGDRKEAGEKVAELGLDKAYTDLLPGNSWFIQFHMNGYLLALFI